MATKKALWLPRRAIFGAAAVPLFVSRTRADEGGLPECKEELEKVKDALAKCQANQAVLPGDGYPNPDQWGVSGHGPALSYTDYGLFFVDNNTGLMWVEQTNNPGGVNDVNAVYSWSNTPPNPDGTLFTVYLPTLNTLPGYGGYTDWRLPTLKELGSLVDYSSFLPPASYPGLTAGGAPGGVGDYWTITTWLSDPSNAWAVGFGSYNPGFFSTREKSLPLPVRAVRNV
jgi:hypothetical protein